MSPCAVGKLAGGIQLSRENTGESGRKWLGTAENASTFKVSSHRLL